jgi:DNA-binding transcriptional LysR family regulator
LARKLDLAMYLANEANPRLDAERLGSFPLHWIGPASDEGAIVHRSPLPLVVLGPECKMRQAASEALTQAGIPWRIVFGSNHLPAMFGAVFAGIGISARTKVGLPEGVRVLPKTVQLPPLPSVHAFLCSAPGEDRRAVLGLKQFLQAEVSLI